MLRGMFGLFLRAIVICWMCIFAAQFIQKFYIEINREVAEMNDSVNRVIIETGLDF